jgi:hypothetical protein
VAGFEVITEAAWQPALRHARIFLHSGMYGNGAMLPYPGELYRSTPLQKPLMADEFA